MYTSKISALASTLTAMKTKKLVANDMCVSCIESIIILVCAYACVCVRVCALRIVSLHCTNTLIIINIRLLIGIETIWG